MSPTTTGASSSISYSSQISIHSCEPARTRRAPGTGPRRPLGVGDLDVRMQLAAASPPHPPPRNASKSAQTGGGAHSVRRPDERPAERDLVGVFEIGPDGQAAREPRHGDVALRARGCPPRCRRRSPPRTWSGWWRSPPPARRPRAPAPRARRSSGPPGPRRRPATARPPARGTGRGTRCVRSIGTTSAGSSTTQITERSRRSSRQIGHRGPSARLKHTSHRPMRSFTSRIAAARPKASCSGTRSTWNARRCAVRWPMPGSFASSVISLLTGGENMSRALARCG